jgi:TPR repeat protein
MSPLPMFVALFLVVGTLPAQENLPRLTTGDLTQTDFRRLLSQADSGDRQAQYRVALADAYPERTSVPKNDAASREWMLRSAEQGCAPAQEKIGMMYMGATGDYGKADLWLRRAAEQGDAAAQFWLALSGFRKPLNKDTPTHRLAWDRCMNMARFVSQSYVLAAKWYRKAAEHVPNLEGEQDRDAMIWAFFIWTDQEFTRIS